MANQRCKKNKTEDMEHASMFLQDANSLSEMHVQDQELSTCQEQVGSTPWNVHPEMYVLKCTSDKSPVSCCLLLVLETNTSGDSEEIVGIM